MQSIPLSSLIESLVQTIQADSGALKERHVLRQTLHALVRQAKVEQVAEMRAELRRMAGLDPGGKRLLSQVADQDSARR